MATPAPTALAHDFPILARDGLVYLDSASTAQKPRAVLDAMENLLLRHNANVHRGTYPLAVEATDRYEADPTLLKKFPDQLGVSFSDGTFHLGGDERTEGVDPQREGYPAGQAVGAIDELIPAGDIVRAMVQEAGRVIAKISAY